MDSVTGQMVCRSVSGQHSCLMMAGMESGRGQECVTHVLQDQRVRLMDDWLLWLLSHLMVWVRLVQLRLVAECMVMVGMVVQVVT